MTPSNNLIMSGFPSSANSVSLVMFSQKMVRASWQLSVSSGFISGSLTLQGSNDQSTDAQNNQFQPTNWASISSASIVCSNTTQGSGVFIIPATELSYEYIRLTFTDANGGNTKGIYQVRQKSMGL